MRPKPLRSKKPAEQVVKDRRCYRLESDRIGIDRALVNDIDSDTVFIGAQAIDASATPLSIR